MCNAVELADGPAATNKGCHVERFHDGEILSNTHTAHRCYHTLTCTTIKHPNFKDLPASHWYKPTEVLASVMHIISGPRDQYITYLELTAISLLVSTT